MDNNREITTTNAQETTEVGKKLGLSLTGRKGSGAATILCLYGDLGSGKTTFTQGFAKGLGITSRLLSPTFIIVRRYGLPSSAKFLYHIDLYRLTNVGDLDELGLPEIFTDLGGFVVIEWAEKLGGVMPKERIDLHFEVLDNGSHKISVRKVTT